MKILFYTTLFFNAIYAQSQRVVVENSDFNLTCQTSSVGRKYSCYLQRRATDYCKFYEKPNNFNRVISLLECSENLNGRVHFVGDVQKGKCIFKVIEAKPFDKGDWACTVDVNYQEKNALEWTKIIVSSSNHHDTTSNEAITVDEGNTVSLKCSRNYILDFCEFVHEDKKCCKNLSLDPRCNCGSRNMKISLAKDRKSCELIIKKASHQDSGVWYCRTRKENHQGEKIILQVIPFVNEEQKFVVLDEIESECSVKCGVGVRTVKKVSCQKSCFPNCCKANVEELPCQLENCLDSFGSWNSWSTCSVPCLRNEQDRSLRNRSRKCIDIDGCNSKDFGK